MELSAAINPKFYCAAVSGERPPMDPSGKLIPENSQGNHPDNNIISDKNTPNLSQKKRWQKNILPAFWSVGSALSILLNIILLAMVLVLAKQVFAIKDLVTNDVVGGLYYNFLLMDQATIKTSVQVEDTIPVHFDLPLKQSTVVILSEDTLIEDATVSMNTGGLNIQQAPTDIILPKGTALPIKLNLTVPVDTEIPISINVPVEIPLNETELHEPFVGLQEVISPYYWMLIEQPSSWPQAKCLYLGIGCP